VAKLSKFFKSDVSLLRAYSDGEAEAFEVLYGRHKDGLYNFLVRSLSQHAIAEEIAQEVWLGVIAQAGNFEPRDATFRTWLFRIARNKVIDYQRRRVNQPHVALDTHDDLLPANELSVEDNFLLRQLMVALDELPAVQRETFILQQEGFSNREISNITGVGQETVKSRLRYAKRATRDRLESGV